MNFSSFGYKQLKEIKVGDTLFDCSGGNNIKFSLGYSHKIDITVPAGLTVVIDKTGQKIDVKSSDKNLLGDFCSEVKRLRLPEPYKGTGIRYEKEIIRRKAGKAKGSA